MQEHHSRQIRGVLEQSDLVALLEMSNSELVADPRPVIEAIAAF